MPGRGMASNIQLLTHAHKIVKAKKRQKREQVKAVVFDEDARRCAHPSSLKKNCIILVFSREFLTGFHKRKLAKKEEGKKKAQAREKQERLETRREVRMFLPLPHFHSQNWIFHVKSIYSKGVCSQSRPPRTQPKLKRHMPASCSVRTTPIYILLLYLFLWQLILGRGGVTCARNNKKNSYRIRRGMEWYLVAIQSGSRWSGTRGGIL
jgi:Nucleolar protein 12 (25kDa)